MRAAPPLLVTTPTVPTEDQRKWLSTGLEQPGGKLPLHDERGLRIPDSLRTACIKAGWAEPWVSNPTAPSRACRLTGAGRAILEKEAVIRVDFTQWKRDTSGESLSLSPTGPRNAAPVVPTTSGLLFQEGVQRRG